MDKVNLAVKIVNPPVRKGTIIRFHVSCEANEDGVLGDKLELRMKMEITTVGNQVYFSKNEYPLPKFPDGTFAKLSLNLVNESDFLNDDWSHPLCLAVEEALGKLILNERLSTISFSFLKFTYNEQVTIDLSVYSRGGWYGYNFCFDPIPGLFEE